ncbi:MAG: hypothetical protein ABJA66_20470 [Actinomycetota bacterium]
MSKPNNEIDGAKVLYWAWSGSVPFGFVGDPKDPMASKIYGVAICQYENSNEFYRFSCDENWETQQDQVYDSVKLAIENLPDQYKNVSADWIEFED